MGAACPMIGTLAIRRRRRRADRGRMCLAAMVGILLLAAACAPGAHPGAGRTEEARALAVRFVTTLAERRYAAAHALTDPSYRARVSAEQLQAEFEQIVPLTFGPVGPVEAGLTQTQWYGQEPGDEAWVYVSVGGQIYSEAVTVVVTRTPAGDRLIRTVEWGRP